MVASYSTNIDVWLLWFCVVTVVISKMQNFEQ